MHQFGDRRGLRAPCRGRRGRLARWSLGADLGGCGRALRRRSGRQPRASSGRARTTVSPLSCGSLRSSGARMSRPISRGRLIGGPRLWPSVSPGKTWSGAVVGASHRRGARPPARRGGPTGSIRLFGLGLATAVVSELGDLFESALKRRFGVKDSSNLIPGHGGLMDRLDAFVAASVFAALVAVFNTQGVLHRERAVPMVSRPGLSPLPRRRLGVADRRRKRARDGSRFWGRRARSAAPARRSSPRRRTVRRRAGRGGPRRRGARAMRDRT